MIGIIARLKIKPGSEAEFEAMSKETIDAVRAHEPGNVFYGLFRNKKTGEYVFLERWRDKAALDAHMNAPHMQKVGPALGALLDGPFDMKQMEEIEPVKG